MIDINNKKVIDFLKKVSPGTPLRTVIDDLMKGELGALIVFDTPELANLIDGGFRVNCRFSSQRLFELCKMDGAVIVSADLKRILYANVTLTPDPSIHTNETGTRHKAGERTAKQANTFVIAVSERRKKITLYSSGIKSVLKSTEELIRETVGNLQVLEKQREIFEELISKLNILEMSGLVSVSDVCKLLQRAEMILKTAETMKRYFTEMGKEGNIMNMRYKELLKGVEKTEEEVIRDYSILALKKAKSLLENFTFDGLLDLESLARLLIEKQLEDNISPRGFRFLSHLTLTEKEASELVEGFKNLDNLFNSSTEDCEKILKNKGELVKQEINNLRDQILSGKVIY